MPSNGETQIQLNQLPVQITLEILVEAVQQLTDLVQTLHAKIDALSRGTEFLSD